jgi:exopolysaccharide production protein ExoQ
MALAVTLGVGLYFCRPRRWYLLGVVPSAICLIECQSRTAVISVVVGLVWLAWRRGFQSAIKVTTVCVVLVTVFGLTLGALGLKPPASLRDIGNRFTTGRASAGGELNSRGVAWSGAIDLWKQQPVEGYGFAASSALFTDQEVSGTLTFANASVHNSYLQLLLELGVLGGLVLAGLILFVVVPASVRGDLRHPGSSLVGLVATGMAVQITESAMFGTGQPYPWIFWLAVCAATLALPEPGTSARSAPGRIEHRYAMATTR